MMGKPTPKQWKLLTQLAQALLEATRAEAAWTRALVQVQDAEAALDRSWPGWREWVRAWLAGEAPEPDRGCRCLPR